MALKLMADAFVLTSVWLNVLTRPLLVFTWDGPLSKCPWLWLFSKRSDHFFFFCCSPRYRNDRNGGDRGGDRGGGYRGSKDYNGGGGGGYRGGGDRGGYDDRRRGGGGGGSPYNGGGGGGYRERRRSRSFSPRKSTAAYWTKSRIEKLISKQKRTRKLPIKVNTCFCGMFQCFWTTVRFWIVFLGSWLLGSNACFFFRFPGRTYRWRAWASLVTHTCSTRISSANINIWRKPRERVRFVFGFTFFCLSSFLFSLASVRCLVQLLTTTPHTYIRPQTILSIEHTHTHFQYFTLGRHLCFPTSLPVVLFRLRKASIFDPKNHYFVSLAISRWLFRWWLQWVRELYVLILTPFILFNSSLFA